jgi:hypothetical protein
VFQAWSAGRRAPVAEIGFGSIDSEEERVATPERRGGGIGGISLGGIIVIVGIVVMLVWSVLLGVIIVLVGLIAFGGFARGRWY